MIKPEQMEDAVYKKLVKSQRVGDPALSSLLTGRFNRNDHVAQQVGVDLGEGSFPHREGDDIGGA